MNSNTRLRMYKTIIIIYFVLLGMACLPALAQDLYTTGRAFNVSDHIVSTTVFHWYTSTTGQLYSPWRAYEGRENWTGEVPFWKDQIKQMMSANIDAIWVHLWTTPGHNMDQQRINLFAALSQLRAEGYDVPKVAPFLDPMITWGASTIDVATAAGKNEFVNQYIHFFNEYFSVNTDQYADSYLQQIGGKVVLDTWHVFANLQNLNSLTRSDVESRLKGAFGEDHPVFNNGIRMVTTGLNPPTLSFADEKVPQFEITAYYRDVTYNIKTAQLKAGYWDQNIRTPGSCLKRDGGIHYVSAWNQAVNNRATVKRVYIESWNEYDEGSGIYRGYTGAPLILNNNPNTDTWSTTNKPTEYIDTTASGAASFNDTPGQDAKILWHNLPSFMLPGEHRTVQVVVRNTGDTKWRGADNYKFGENETLNPVIFSNGRFIINDQTSEIPTYGGIFRGRPITFNIELTAPLTPGTYTTHWSMLQEHVAWFGETLAWNINIWPNPYVTSDVANGIYKTGAAIPLKVKFPMNVFITGVPSLELETGSIDRKAAYISGSGTDTLTFMYNVQQGDISSDLDYTSQNALTLNGGSIKDTAGNNVDLILPIPGDGGSLRNIKDIIIDTAPTTVLSVKSNKPDGLYTTGEQINIQVKHETPVFVTGTPQIELETGLIDSRANYVSGSGTDTLTFLYIVQQGDENPVLDYTGINALIMNGGSIRDLSGVDIDPTLPLPGTDLSISSNKTIAIDAVSPVVTNVTSTIANGMYRLDGMIYIQVTFSKSVTVTSSPRLRLETGEIDQLAIYLSGNNSTTLTFLYQFQPGDTSPDLDYAGNDAFLLNGGTVRDAIGNDADLALFAPGTPGSLSYNKDIVVDAIKPTVTSVTSNKPDGAYKAGENIDIQILFSEIVNVTGTPQLELETGTVDRKAAYISGTGTNTLTFRYTVQPADASTDLNYKATNSLTLPSASIKDIAGNTATLTLPALTSQGALAYSKSIVIDTVAPSSSAAPSGGVYSGAKSVALTASESANIYFTLDGSEPNASSITYSSPITLTTDTILRFYGVDSAGNEESPKKQEVYIILTDDGSIASAKQLTNGQQVRLGNKALYLKWLNFAYIEEKERWSGIRVEGSINANPGDLVCLTGTIGTSAAGEKYILIDRLTPSGIFSVDPLGCSNAALGRPLTNGLYVRTWGTVIPGSVIGNSFLLTDGSNGTGVKVITQGTPGVSDNQFIIVTGTAGYENGRILYKE